MTVRKAITDRYTFHLKNALNPYYKEELAAQQATQKATEAAAAQQAVGTPVGQAIPSVASTINTNAVAPAGAGSAKANEAAMVEPPNPMELTQKTDSSAGKLGKAGKGRAALSKEQRSTIV